MSRLVYWIKSRFFTWSPEWSVHHGFCPQCNSNAPNRDTCMVCGGLDLWGYRGCKKVAEMMLRRRVALKSGLFHPENGYNMAAHLDELFGK